MKKKIIFFVITLVAVTLTGSALVQAELSINPLEISSKKEAKEKVRNEVLESDAKIESEYTHEPESSVCGEMITDRDGYTYTTVQIGDQCWMQENLRTKTKADGTCINGGTAPCPDASAADNGKGRSCYDNNEAMCASEGALYTYNGIGGTLNTPGNQGICPDGWHIPTHNELTTLERSVCISGSCDTDFPYDQSTVGWRGTDEGTTLKENGCSRFNAKMTGRREANGITFTNRLNSTWLWSSDYAAPSVYRRLLTADSSQIHRDAGNLSFNRSQSLRCVRNVPVVSFCGEIVTDRDGYTYKTVRIGDQCWMQENLRTKTKADGTCINGGTAPCPDASAVDNGKGRSCYGNNEVNCSLYGALYTYIGIGGTLNTPGNQGICPNGWRLPTHDDFTILERAVCISGSCDTDFPYDQTTVGWRGTDEGTTLKENGCSRFNAKMTGRREANGISFTNLENYTWFWTSEYSNPSVYRRLLSATSTQVHRDAGNLSSNRSQSLRCLKNL